MIRLVVIKQIARENGGKNESGQKNNTNQSITENSHGRICDIRNIIHSPVPVSPLLNIHEKKIRKYDYSEMILTYNEKRIIDCVRE